MADVDTKAEAQYRKRVEYIPYRVALTFYVCISIAIVTLFALQGRAIHHQCLENATNRGAIRATVIDGLPALGAAYDPKTDRVVPRGQPIDYYVSHFEERQKQLRIAIRALDRFPRIECSGSNFNVLGGGS